MKKIIYLLFLLLASGNSFSQFYTEVTYTTKEGLKSNEVKDIIQAKDGHLWMINGGELVKYNGKEFTFIQLKDDIKRPTSYSSNELTQLNSGDIILRNSEFTKLDHKTNQLLYYKQPKSKYLEDTDNPGRSQDMWYTFINHPFNKEGDIYSSNFHGVYKHCSDTTYIIQHKESDSLVHFHSSFGYSPKKDKAGNLWAYSIKNNIYKIENEKLHLFDLNKYGFNTEEHEFRVINGFDSGNILFLNWETEYQNGRTSFLDSNIYLFRKDLNRIDTIKGLFKELKWGRNIEYGDKVFGTSFEKGAFYYDYNTGEKHIITHEFCNQVDLFNNTIIFWTGWGESSSITLYDCKKATINTIPFLITKTLNKVLIDDDENIWLACKNSLSRFSKSKVNFKAESLFVSDDFKKSRGNIVIDNNENILYGPNSTMVNEFGELITSEEVNSLFKFNPVNLKTSKILSGKDAKYEIRWDSKNKQTWISDGASIFRYKNNQIHKVLDLKRNFGGFKVINGACYFYSPLPDYSNELCVVINNELISLGEKYFILSSENNQNVLFSNQSNNHQVFELNNDFQLETVITLDSSEKVDNAIKISDDSFWVFSNRTAYHQSNGAFIKKDNAYFSIGKEDQIKRIVVDNNNNIWAKTNLGIILFSLQENEIQSKQFGKNDGLSSSIINDLFIDSNQVLWISTPMGIDKFNLNDYYKKNLVRFEHLGEKEGLKDINCQNFINRNNKLIVITNSGYAIIDDSRVLSNTIAPVPNYSSISVVSNDRVLDEREILNDNSILKFDNYFATIFIDFNTIKYNNTEAIYYSALLYDGNELLYGGFDSRSWSNEEHIKYENLGPGNYKVELYCKVGMSGEKSPPVIMRFSILPAWWQTIWAKAIYIFIATTLVFSVFRLRTKSLLKKQKILEREISNATHQIREQHEEIVDSINYAKRIQSAILPPPKLVKEYLKNSFILYKPKDIVAGDFYWMEQNDNEILFAAADCTGHGVPGAMVSVICNNALNRSVREYGLTDPGKILDKTREIVTQEFEKSEEEVKDGMDIALCSLNGNKLEYAGAHNPLWIIRNGEIIETKANKQPIGKFDNLLPYTTNTFELEKNDTIYIFSDGYPDQFGGEKGKKYKSGKFKKFLLSIQEHSMEKQRELLDAEFENWRGSIEQIDDVCVIGVRI